MIQFHRRMLLCNALGILLTWSVYLLRHGPTADLYESGGWCLVMLLVMYALFHLFPTWWTASRSAPPAGYESSPVVRRIERYAPVLPLLLATIAMVVVWRREDDPLSSIDWLLIPMAGQVGTSLAMTRSRRSNRR